MNVTDFNVRLSEREGASTERGMNLPIAQISEVISKANIMLGGRLYKMIHELPEGEVPVPKEIEGAEQDRASGN